MAKKDNQPEVAEAAPAVQSNAEPVAPVELAPIADLQARVEELEKARPLRPRARLEDVPLTHCNRRHQEVMKEVRAERHDVITQVTRALTNALGGRPTNERRVRKDLAGHAAELRASVKPDKA